jgi:hypothetical protein
VKRAVELMGGRVGFEPGAANGSRFWIELQSYQGLVQIMGSLCAKWGISTSSQKMNPGQGRSGG